MKVFFLYRLFHTLFFKIALVYARTFPRPVRRFIEFIMLIKAIAALFVLVYIHIAFSRSPTTCLEHVKDTWPKDGILRVEIIRNVGQVLVYLFLLFVGFLCVFLFVGL